MDIIEKDRHSVTDCMLELISKWVTHFEGTGDLPRTWQTVVNAVRYSGHLGLAMELARKHDVTLTQQQLSQQLVSVWYSV